MAERITYSEGTYFGTVSTGTTDHYVEIIEDTPPPRTIMYGSSTYPVNEGDPVTVTVSISESTSQSLEIPITKTGGSAESTDYSGVPGSVTISSGTSETFSVSTNQDNDCDNETV